MVTDSTALVAIERLLDLGRHVLRLRRAWRLVLLGFGDSLAHRRALVADQGREFQFSRLFSVSVSRQVRIAGYRASTRYS